MLWSGKDKILHLKLIFHWPCDFYESRGTNYSQGVYAFRGVDEGGVGKLAGNVTFTNKELYDSLKERVLESPAAFTSLLSSPDEDDDDSDNVAAAGTGYQPQSSYKPPVTVPDSELTAGKCSAPSFLVLA